ncbi:Glycosyltransferase involved in cell wall bisynthesis [Flavobacteriaceae bacterium MAR_2010_188]|nr:Glycosyltransferase involved in cell wall bisynthesis [Flavobacteriaceae bacterium MAR_2010_188]
MKLQNSTLSALIITHNEANHINELIENVSFADEIIVVDSFSEDGTIERLQQYPNVKVFQNKFLDFANQRNFAISKATSNWILFIDADERLPKLLVEEIKEKINVPTNIVAYKIPRKFVFKEKILNYSGLQTDFILRLFKRGKANYDTDIKVHEVLKVNGRIGKLKNPMLHYSYSDYKSYKAKTEHYARLKAKMLFEKGARPTWFDLYIKPVYKFLYNYIFRLGFLDGNEGLIICQLNAYGVKYRYEYLNELFLGSPKE